MFRSVCDSGRLYQNKLQHGYLRVSAVASFPIIQYVLNGRTLAFYIRLSYIYCNATKLCECLQNGKKRFCELGIFTL